MMWFFKTWSKTQAAVAGQRSGQRYDVIGREFEVKGHADQLSTTSTNNKYGEMTGIDLAVLATSPGQCDRLIAPACSAAPEEATSSR